MSVEVWIYILVIIMLVASFVMLGANNRVGAAGLDCGPNRSVALATIGGCGLAVVVALAFILAFIHYSDFKPLLEILNMSIP